MDMCVWFCMYDHGCMAMYVWPCMYGCFSSSFFLVGYVEERLWWPIQGPNKGREKKAKS